MIEALYQIGKIQKEGDFLEEFIENIGDNYKHVFKIVIDITNSDKYKYKGIDYEEFDSLKKMKYFYKKGSSRGIDKTPTSRITEIDKTLKIKVYPFFETFLKNNKTLLSDEDNQIIAEIDKTVKNNFENMKNDLKKFITDNGISLKDPSILTFIFRKNRNDFYIGDLDLFKKVFLRNQNIAYKDFYKKFGKESKAKNKRCYVCKNNAKEVWGFVNTYNFYTVDKESYVAGGFDQRLAWRNYPVCPDCAKILERGKKYADTNLIYKFCGFNYYIIPEMVIDNDNLLKKVLDRFKRYDDFSLSEKKSAKIERVEEQILRELAKENNNVDFNFLFFKKSNNEFKILLYIQDVTPTRLNFLIKAKDEVDTQKRKYPIFVVELKTKQENINLDFSFSFVRDFFPNKKLDGKFDKYFLSIVNNIFIGKKISADFLYSRFMDKIISEFLNDRWYESWVLKSYKILLYLEKIKVLKRRYGEMRNYGSNFEEFFAENTLMDDNVKKGVFLEGVLAKKLLNIQYQERGATPFRSRLNGLKIDEKVAKRLLPEIINKLEEYNKNYYVKLEEAIGEYFIHSDFAKYSVDELSYYFTLGLVLAKHFKFENENNENNPEN